MNNSEKTASMPTSSPLNVGGLAADYGESKTDDLGRNPPEAVMLQQVRVNSSKDPNKLLLLQEFSAKFPHTAVNNQDMFS